MKTIIILLSLFYTSILLASPVGTQTFAQVKQADISKTYLDLNKIVVTKEKVKIQDSEKELLCFTINDTYKITEERELLLLLLEILIDMKIKTP